VEQIAAHPEGEVEPHPGPSLTPPPRHCIPVSEETWASLTHLAEDGSEEALHVGDVVAFLIRLTALALGVRGTGDLNGFKAKFRMIQPLEDDYVIRAVVAAEALNAIILFHGVGELKPLLDEAVRILLEKYKGGQVSGGGEP